MLVLGTRNLPKSGLLVFAQSHEVDQTKPAAPAPFEKARPDSPAPTKAQQKAAEEKAAANKAKREAAKAKKKAATGAVAINMADATPDGASPLNR